MPSARYALAACILSDRVYAMGGSDARESPDLGTNELYLPLGYGTVAQSGVAQAILIGAVVAAVAVVAIVVVLLGKRTKKGT